MNKCKHSYKLSQLYAMVGITKQGHYKRVARQQQVAAITSEVISAAHQVRKAHQRMGCRKLYSLMGPKGMGRDKVEAILLSNGFRVKRKRNYRRTTYAGPCHYPNHISGLQVSGLHQLWVSDITYIPVAYDSHYYLTLVMDVYSRKIVGWALSQGMRADQTVLPAYQMAIASLSQGQGHGLIFHSDKGSQYLCQELAGYHKRYGVLPSMGGKAWENAHAESVNGILKNEYIDFKGVEISLTAAYKMIKTIIKRYNHERPHGSLKNMKPIEFETFVHQLADGQKPIVTINY